MNEFNRRAFLSKSFLSFFALMTGPNGFSAGEMSLKKRNWIPTITGKLMPKDLGITLMHEHILHGEIPEHKKTESIEIAVKLLNEAADAGVKTIVDVTAYRNIQLLRQIAERVRLKIVTCTGYYIRERMPVALRNITEAQLEERMYREVTEGIDGTKIKAGIIKVAADNHVLSDWDKMIFRVAARVHKSTKVPIATHAWIGARAQFEYLVSLGADPNHINLSHIETVGGWRGNSREQIAAEFLPIVKGGGYLLFNNFGCEFYTPWTDMVYLLKYYCDKGFANRIFISEDCNWEWKNDKQVFEAQEEHPEASKRTYAYMMEHEIPMMKDAGFTNEVIRTFTVDNPRNFFTIN